MALIWVVLLLVLPLPVTADEADQHEMSVVGLQVTYQ
jgi:hypothetical protein